MAETDALGPCPVCGRIMLAGPSVDRHHWVPKSEGGFETDDIHVVCHRMIHRIFDERELATTYADPAALRGHPEIERFITWVRRQPPEYVDWPKSPRRRR